MAAAFFLSNRRAGMLWAILVPWLLAVAVGAGPASAGASGSTVERHLSFQSRALGGAMAYSLYLPPGFDRQRGPYPVIYLLHGVTDDDTVWLQEGKLQETADRLIGAGALPPTIIVLPDGKMSWYGDGADCRC